ncbi:MAG: hypothetical protein IJV97_05550 [Alphaproteobacteria bacterium]|nr:hypothetical protein [Alphaproteobacteria bacterium]
MSNRDKLSTIGHKKRVLCNGGFMDGLFMVNQELRKRGKKEAIGFEKDLKAAQHNHNRIRFFDKDNQTVWLPDDMYKKINLQFIKMGAMEIGRQEYPKLLATGNCKSFEEWLQEKKQQIRKICSNFVSNLKSR